MEIRFICAKIQISMLKKDKQSENDSAYLMIFWEAEIHHGKSEPILGNCCSFSIIELRYEV